MKTFVPSINNQKNGKLSAAEYLYLQHEKHRLTQMNIDITRMRYRQEKHLVWIVLLSFNVSVLAIGLLYVLIF